MTRIQWFPGCRLPDACANEAVAGTNSSNADNSDSVTTAIGASGIDLVLVSFTDTPDPTAPGGIATYEAIVTNAGPATASGVLVRTALSPKAGLTLTHVSSSGSNGFVCTFAAFVDCTGNLPSGQSTTIKMLFQVAGAVPPDKIVTVTTTADPLGAIAESDGTNNELSTVTTVHANCAGCEDLVTSAIFATPDVVVKNEYVTFSVGVGNAGDTASGTFKIELKLTDSADVDFEPGGFDASQPSDDYTASADFECTALGNTVTCDDSASATPGLEPGEGALINLKVHVKSTATNPGAMLEVKADSDNTVTEYSESNNDQTVTVSILP